VTYEIICSSLISKLLKAKLDPEIHYLSFDTGFDKKIPLSRRGRVGQRVLSVFLGG
jgi:hypothetical protein